MASLKKVVKNIFVTVYLTPFSKTMNLPETIDRYNILELLGEGGMSRVYRAFDPHFQREVAIKVLHGHLLTDSDSERRFTNEARTIAQLEANAIVPVYDFGRLDETAFIVMRLMKGGTLQDRMTGQPLDPSFIDQMMRRLCAALDRAHNHQVIHRDLKPANILFDDDEMAYLADFGIARMTEGTQTSSIIGTAHYMAPEQAQGKPLDARTDVYQLGVILFEMLTGQQPFRGETTASVLYQHVYEPIPRLTAYLGNIPAQFQALIDAAMAKDPDQRPSSAGELYNLFKIAAEGQDASPIATDPLITDIQPQMETIVDPAVADLPHPIPFSDPESDFQTPTGSGRPAWLFPILTIVAVLILASGGLWLMRDTLFAPSPTDEPTQVVVVVTQIVPDPEGESENAIQPTPQETVLPTPVPQPTETPTPAGPSLLSDSWGGGSGFIGYASNRNGNYDIFVRPLDQDREFQLTTDPANDFGPVWSPDGRFIAYHTFQDGNWEVYLMDNRGGGQRNLTQSSADDAFPRWSPNGNFIAFHSNRDSDFEIFIVDVDGTDVRQLTDNAVDDFGPAWSPDGQRIAFHRRIDNRRQIFLMNRDGSFQEQLTFGLDESVFPLWSPDGSQLLYQVTDGDERSRIYLMNADGSGQRPITPAAQDAFFPSWSPDGLWILYHARVSDSSNRDIFALQIDSSEPERVTNSTVEERMPVWQPVMVDGGQ